MRLWHCEWPAEIREILLSLNYQAIPQGGPYARRRSPKIKSCILRFRKYKEIKCPFTPLISFQFILSFPVCSETTDENVSQV